MTNECSIEKCRNLVDTYCYHCSQDLCTNHLNEHKKWIEKQLLPVVNQVNTMYEHLHQIDKNQTMVTLDYLNDIREQMDQWKVSCYQQIDDVYEQVQKQINTMVEKHRNQIIERAANNLESIKQLRRRLGALLKEDQIEYRLLDNIREELEGIEQTEHEIDQPNIRILTEKLNVDNLVHLIISLTADLNFILILIYLINVKLFETFRFIVRQDRINKEYI
ncbi:unnamed protein product, partial [Adineta ricciae]